MYRIQKEIPDKRIKIIFKDHEVFHGSFFLHGSNFFIEDLGVKRLFTAFFLANYTMTSQFCSDEQI